MGFSVIFSAFFKEYSLRFLIMVILLLQDLSEAICSPSGNEAAIDFALHICPKKALFHFLLKKSK